MRAKLCSAIALLALAAACGRDSPQDPASTGAARARAPVVTVSADQAVSPVAPWRAPAVAVTPGSAAALRRQADDALRAGRLFGSDAAAIPLYLALARQSPDDASLQAALARARAALIAQGDAALAGIDDDPLQLRRAHEAAAVARVLAPSDADVQAFLDRVDRADEVQAANRMGERELNAGRIDPGTPNGAIAWFGKALALRPGDARALQGLAAVESALIRRAEQAAEQGDYAQAEVRLGQAATVRPGLTAVDDARGRIALQRALRINALRDAGLAALADPDDGIDRARAQLAAMLRIARAGDPAAVDLRERIELATHYGLFRPGQVFTDGLGAGARGPALVVIPHGAFRMGAADGEADATDAERPARNIRFERGLAVSRTEVTVGEFRRFVAATGHRTRAERRGYSIAYDERSGNLTRRSRVDWRHDYAGNPAPDDHPVIHVSAKDAFAYADWLSERSRQTYRLPSEAEFEYVLRAGRTGRFPWGDGAPPARAGNVTGAADASPSGRRWSNAFAGYTDGAWGPMAVGRYAPNAFGLHDLAGNVSEWVADCWHDTYRRAPRDGEAWVNPGCRSRVVRGGSWASSPAQTRSAWRIASDADTTNARVGFRVVREL